VAERARKKRKRLQEQLDELARLGNKCSRCGTPIANPVTRRGKVRFVCADCYKAVRAISKDKRPKAVNLQVREFIYQAKIATGVARPKNAIRTVPKARNRSVLGEI
jgi:uncharacterized Zn finger protein (UPF0148 family)